MCDNDCKAKQYSDQMVCGRCRLSWDVNDPFPPDCKNKFEIAKMHLDDIREIINTKKRHQ